MGRRIRKNDAGCYHLVNRGVGLREVFLSTEDRVFFIKLICNYAKEHTYIIHGYALVGNGYNILIETKQDNLSNIMKIINARYTAYFNKRYGRRGYLWEGRFKSWYIDKRSLVLDILLYIEHLPIYTGSAKTKESSLYSTYRQFVGIDQRLPCIYDSLIFQTFNDEAEIKKFFQSPVNIEYINTIHESLRKQSNDLRVKQKKRLTTLSINTFASLSIEERNKKIYQKYYEGYSQTKIGELVGISQQAIYKIIKKMSIS